MYNASAATLNLVPAPSPPVGYADLRQVHAWNQDFVRNSPAGQRYEQLAREIDNALAFMNACGVAPEEFKTVEFYSSHEALILDYETAMTRTDSRTGDLYDVSGHMVWIGERTRQLDHAHIEFAAKVRNPIGVKPRPDHHGREALTLIERLDPEREPRPPDLHHPDGRGQGPRAPAHPVEKVTAPAPSRCGSATRCTANTFEASSGHKTRRFDDVLDEVKGFFEVHRALAPTRAASTSSSPVTTSPSASAVATRCWSTTCTSATRRPATRA
ncbi:hypothetical protein GCM10020229_06030 [Kitasatospora albolonga]